MSSIEQRALQLTITARQYGEVVLPDEASGQGPGTPSRVLGRARKLSRCKEGTAQFLPSWYTFYCVLARSRYNFDASDIFITGYKFYALHWRSVAVQTVSEPEISQCAGFNLHADARVRVQEPLQLCLRCRSIAKTVTNNLPILSVLCLGLFCQNLP